LRGSSCSSATGSLGLGSLLGFVFSIEFVLLYWGIEFTTASRAIIFMYLAPFVVAIGAHLLIPASGCGLIQVIGLLCAFAGMLVAFSDALRLPTYRELTGRPHGGRRRDPVGLDHDHGQGDAAHPGQPGQGAALPARRLGAAAAALSLALVSPASPRRRRLALAAFAYRPWVWRSRHTSPGTGSSPTTRRRISRLLVPGAAARRRRGGRPPRRAYHPGAGAAGVLVALGIYLINRKPRTAASAGDGGEAARKAV